MTTGERIRNRRQELKMSADTLAEKVGVNRATIYRYENGDIESMSTDVLEPLAKALHTTPMYLMGWEDAGSSSAAVPEGLHGIRRISLPILGEVACGEPKYAAEEYHGTVSADGDFHADFCLIAKGDSMINIGIHEGTIVFVRIQQSVENGEVAVVLFEDDATLKRVYFYPDAGLMVLHAENPRYKDMTFTGEQLNSVRILGKAVFYQNRIE